MAGGKSSKNQDSGKGKSNKTEDSGKEKANQTEDSGKETAKPMSRSARAGLKFPVGRIHRHLKSRTTSHVRVGATAAVYSATIMEYLTSEVIEMAGMASKDHNAKRITARHLQLAIRGDEDLTNLVKAIIPGGGVIPHIHAPLLPKDEESPGPEDPEPEKSQEEETDEEAENEDDEKKEKKAE
ncbi:uncharacterized protein Dana_GF20259 [Drosophila ananassae]|uniref:Histone H2A n=1 Tax=Drosophila ananassae TaxID=7217 RepID=B3MQE5_DROAN|nr:histone H2A.V [Drosophila ananassae]EDV44571.1 uncharacterized protein Dana_GF20259 [Drosophila ananassae]